MPSRRPGAQELCYSNQEGLPACGYHYIRPQTMVPRAPGRGHFCTKVCPHQQNVRISDQKRRPAGDTPHLSEDPTLGLDCEWGGGHRSSSHSCPVRGPSASQGPGSHRGGWVRGWTAPSRGAGPSYSHRQPWALSPGPTCRFAGTCHPQSPTSSPCREGRRAWHRGFRGGALLTLPRAAMVQ